MHMHAHAHARADFLSFPHTPTLPSRATLPLLRQLQQCPQEVLLIMDKVGPFKAPS